MKDTGKINIARSNNYGHIVDDATSLLYSKKRHLTKDEYIDWMEEEFVWMRYSVAFYKNQAHSFENMYCRIRFDKKLGIEDEKEN